MCATRIFVIVVNAVAIVAVDLEVPVVCPPLTVAVAARIHFLLCEKPV